MSRMVWSGPDVTSKVSGVAAQALTEGAEHLLEEANRRVPHDTGALENSGETSVDAANLEAAVSYDTPYAARLHEHPNYNFRHNREGKWLEKAFNERSSAITEHIVKRLRSAF